MALLPRAVFSFIVISLETMSSQYEGDLKKISGEHMTQLRQVLRGKDRVAIWILMQELELSPNDKVREKFITNLNASGARATAGRAR